jgi:parallel beta-helix repeat protein
MGNGIIVNADNVTIDLMGFTMTGITGYPQKFGIGIKVAANTEIRNGTISLFNNGISADPGKLGSTVVNVRVNNCYMGIYVYQGLVKDCMVNNNDLSGITNLKGVVTGNTVFGNNTGLNLSEYTVTNNTVTANSNMGIYVGDCLIDGNTVFNNPTNINYYGGPCVFGTNKGIP